MTLTRNTSVVWGEYKIRHYGWACRCCSAAGWAPSVIPWSILSDSWSITL